MPSISINNIIYSWTSCTLRYDGIPFGEGVQQFDYDQSRERKMVYGSRKDGKPIGRTGGKYAVAPIALKMTLTEADRLTSYLTTKGLGSYGDAEFTISLNVTEVPSSHIPLVVMAEACTIDGKKNAAAEGTDELVVEFTIGCMSIVENGKTLFSVKGGL